MSKQLTLLEKFFDQPTKLTLEDYGVKQKEDDGMTGMFFEVRNGKLIKRKL